MVVSFINLGRHNQDADYSRPDAGSFDYSLVWLGALLEALNISSDNLLLANVKKFRQSFMMHTGKGWSDYMNHKLPPSQRIVQQDNQGRLQIFEMWNMP
jgi:hypothetical protein